MSDHRGNNFSSRSPHNTRNANNTSYARSNRYSSLDEEDDEYESQSRYSSSQQRAAGTASNGNNVNGNNSQNSNLINVPWDLYELKRRPRYGTFCTVLSTIGSVITFARNLCFNILFILLLIVLFCGYSAFQSFKENGFMLDGKTPIDDGSLPQAEVLYFDLDGNISELPFASSQLSNLQRQLELSLYGRKSHELISIEKALHLVATDPQIKKVVISVDGMGPMSLSMAERLGHAMDQAKGPAKNREVVVTGMNISQAAYALAAHANKVILDPLGSIDLKGIAMSSLYFKDFLDRFEITPYIFRAGHFKSAVEPFMLNNMSPDVRKAYQAIAFKSWDIYQKSIQKNRTLKSTNLLPDAAVYANWLTQFKGDLAHMQLAQGLVDEVKPADDYMIDLSQEVNVDADFPYLPAIITYQDYLARYHMHSEKQKSINNALAARGSSHAAAITTANATVAATSATALTASAVDATTAVASKAVSETLGAASSASSVDATGLTSSVSATGLTSSVSTASTVPVATIASVTNALRADDPVTSSDSSDATSSKNPVVRFPKAMFKRNNSKNGTRGNEVKVIYGIGEITDYSDNPQAFTYDNIAPLIEDAQNDAQVGAVVLYLNSPGGSVTASEKIRRAFELFQTSGKPLIVSMNGTAASGAYWIASQADNIFATESTITGSIGVFGLGFGVHKLLNHYGAYQDGVVTNDLALSAVAKEMPVAQQRMLSLSVEHTYRQFIELVSRNRGLKVNEYEIFGEGQIFLADEARTIGLVDEIGDIHEAIDFAAKRAGIRKELLQVTHVAPDANRELGGLEGLFFGLATAYLPEQVTYTLLELKKQSQLFAAPDNKSIMAISPVSEPLL